MLDQVNGNAMEIVAEIDCKDAPMVEMNVSRSLNEEAVTHIMFFKERGMRNRQLSLRSSLVTIDSSRSSILPEYRPAH